MPVSQGVNDTSAIAAVNCTLLGSVTAPIATTARTRSSLPALTAVQPPMLCPTRAKRLGLTCS